MRDIALAYPEAREELWEGERVLKVRRRAFLLLKSDDRCLQVSARLPASREAALKSPFAQPVQYRLGRSDWITARFASGDEPPMELLWEWIDESYRAAAPRALLAHLSSPPPVPRATARRKQSK